VHRSQHGRSLSQHVGRHAKPQVGVSPGRGCPLPLGPFIGPSTHPPDKTELCSAPASTSRCRAVREREPAVVCHQWPASEVRCRHAVIQMDALQGGGAGRYRCCIDPHRHAARRHLGAGDRQQIFDLCH
jgi:hypothetical protein